MPAYQLKNAKYGDGKDRRVPIRGLTDYEFIGNQIIDTDEDLSTYVTGGLLITLTDAQVTARGGADLTVTPVSTTASKSILEMAAPKFQLINDINTVQDNRFSSFDRASVYLWQGPAKSVEYIEVGVHSPGTHADESIAVQIRRFSRMASSLTVMADFTIPGGSPVSVFIPMITWTNKAIERNDLIIIDSTHTPGASPNDPRLNFIIQGAGSELATL